MDGIFFNTPIERNFLGHQMAEIYKENVYAPLIKDRHDLTILDVGSNVGLASYYFSQYAKIVYSLEPSIEHYKVLTYMLNYNKIKNVKPYKLAIFNKSGDYPLFHNESNSTMYSLHQRVSDNTTPPETVKAITLDEFFESEKIKHVDLLKLDVEGSEFEVVGGTGFKKVAGMIDAIIGEIHEWAGRNPSQIKQALEINGFKYSKIPSSANLFIGTK